MTQEKLCVCVWGISWVHLAVTDGEGVGGGGMCDLIQQECLFRASRLFEDATNPSHTSAHTHARLDGSSNASDKHTRKAGRWMEE